MSAHIAVVGSINADLAVRVSRHPLPGETLLGSDARVSAGGKGANQAVAAAQLGATVKFVGAVGSDAYAVSALAYLESSGMDLAGVARVEDSTGLAVITVAANGENTIVVVPGANAHVDADYVQAVEQCTHAISEADIVLIQGEIPGSGNERAVQLAQGRVVINLAPVVPIDRQVLLKANPLVANEHEAGLILEQLGAPLPEGGESNPQGLIAALIEQGFAAVVLTLGARGALCAEGTVVTPIPAAEITAVDTTGAGDAFTGALVAQLVQGVSLVEACRFAARVGAYAATQAGAQSSYPHSDSPLPELADE
ncbi:MAG: ribokinase [Arcanobacterium sp.]|nr:ribokinase [Arcanobacterium sp.]MDY5589285.1 ribokinase [Arcanobacterium sp.]